jgi:two-component system chemotaxis sensor kinase CheA
MNTMDEIRETFFLECEDLLQDLEAGLSAIRDGDRDPEKVNSVFRAVHSIKGGAGAFGLHKNSKRLWTKSGRDGLSLKAS